MRAIKMMFWLTLAFIGIILTVGALAFFDMKNAIPMLFILGGIVLAGMFLVFVFGEY